MSPSSIDGVSLDIVRPAHAAGSGVAAPHRALGVAAIVVSATAMGAAGLFGRFASPAGVPMGEALTLGRMLVGALGMVALLGATRRLRELVRTPLSPPVVLGGILLGVSLATYLASTLLIDLSLAVALHYIGPLLSAALAWLLLGERPSRSDATAMALSFTGMMLVAGVVGPHAGVVGHDEVGALLALVSGLTYGGALLSYRYRPDMPSDVRSLWNFTFGALAVGAMVAVNPPDLRLMTASNWVWATGFFLVCGFGALGLLVVAGKHLRSVELSGLSYGEVVVAALIGTAAFGEPFGLLAAVGTGLILVGAVLPLRPGRP